MNTTAAELALTAAATNYASGLISKVPSSVELDRALICSMLELAFMEGAKFGMRVSIEKLVLALATLPTEQ
jgi:hypothetical protein